VKGLAMLIVAKSSEQSVLLVMVAVWLLFPLAPL
jgi:hypothetical protein